MQLLAIDLGKRSFHVHGIDDDGVVVSRRVGRAKLEALVEELDPSVIAMEACATAHHWGRTFEAAGRMVRLINPRFVKPFARGSKNDAVDAEAIFDAASRPGMRFVPVKTVAQQDLQSLHRARDRIVASRTSLINHIRGLMAEYGLILPAGAKLFARRARACVEDAALTAGPIKPDTTTGCLDVAALAMAPAIALGFGRFAYALVLPAMAATLGLTWAQAGWLNGANAAGYLIGALGASAAMVRLGGPATVGWGVAVSVAGCALTADFALLFALRLLTGAGGALAFVAGGVLAASAAQGSRGGLLLGLFYAGPGFGIAASGIATSLWFAGGGGWQGAWLLLAGLSAAMALPLAWSLAGRHGTRGGPAVAPAPLPLLAMAPILLAYATFGFGYIGYMTFVFAWVREAWGEGAGQAGFWVLIGAAGMAAPWLWAGLLDRLPPARAFSVLTALCGIAAALPLTGEGTVRMLASAAIFGASFFAVVASTTQFVRRNMAPAGWARGVAAMTVSFSLGQTTGPVLAGAMADAAGGLAAALALSAGGLIAAALLALAQRPLRPA